MQKGSKPLRTNGSILIILNKLHNRVIYYTNSRTLVEEYVSLWLMKPFAKLQKVLSCCIQSCIILAQVVVDSHSLVNLWESISAHPF